MDLVQKVIEAIGGVHNAVCASFLSQLEIYDVGTEIPQFVTYDQMSIYVLLK